MKKIKSIYTIVLILLLTVKAFGQIAIGEWRTHLPYYYCDLVMVTENKAYCSSTGGLFYYDLLDNSLNTLSKTDGLSDNGVSAMNWSAADQLSVLAYENANIDIIKGNQIINIPDIFMKQIPGDKSINHIYFLDQKAYLSCGFGIVVLDLKKYEILETYYIGENGNALAVNQVTSDGLYLYAATDDGLRRALISDPFLIDFNSWEKVSDLPEPDGSYSGVVLFNGNIFTVLDDPLDIEDKVYYYDNNWTLYSMYSDADCNEIRVEGDYLILSGKQGVKIMSKDFIFISEYLEGLPKSAVRDELGRLWIADFGRGMIKVENGQEETIRPNGPFSSVAYDMVAADGKLFAVSGGVSATYNNLFRSGTLHTFGEERWGSNVNYDFRDLLSLAVDPLDPTHLYAASWGYGLVEYRDSKLQTIYNEFNSSLQDAMPGPDFNVVRIGGIAFDSDNNLWMTNTAVSEPISVLKNDGSWKSYSVGGLLSPYPALGEILISEAGNIWGIIPKGNGLFALNMNGTIDDTDDDEYKLVSVVDEYGKVITNEVFSIAEDLNGNIWLGTNQGILVYYTPSRLFTDGSVYAKEILVPRDDGTDYADRLLITEKITCIEVDGANRKWIGTADGGAFLVSENGFEQIYNFNVGNSPLLSNSIADICVDGESGEVFFGTDKGIISYRAESTIGADNYNDVKVFPNPVRETYEGPISISGLMEETIVKITDVSGNLVYEMESFGGQAIWDGKNFNGKRVATGPYLIFLANKGNSGVISASVTKILFIH